MKMLWKVCCVTEDLMVDKWSDDKPTVCPNNVAHTIDSDKTVMRTHAMTDFFMYDSNGDVWKVTMGTDGTFTTAKQT